MIGWAVVAVYVVGWWASIVPTYRYLHRELATPDGGPDVLLYMLTAVAALFWPLALLGVVVASRVAAANDRDAPR